MLQSISASLAFVVTAGCVLGVGSPAFAQDVTTSEDMPSQRSDDLVTWAPQWKVGDWWLVKVYQPSLDLETSDSYSAPASGEGAPRGFAPTNRLLYQVARRELVRYPSDSPKAKPEAFLVVTVRGLDGLRNPTAELWYTEEDMTLAKVVTSKRSTKSFLTGTAQLCVDSSGSLGVPLEWPDFRAATKAKATLRGDKGQQVRQQVKPAGRARVSVKLQGPARKAAKAKPGTEKPRQPPRVLFHWQEGRPSWSRVRTRDRYAELIRFGDERKLPRRYRRNN